MLFFPQTYQLVSTHVVEDAVVIIKGRLDKREDVPRLVASEVRVPDLSEGPRGPVVIQLPVSKCVPPVVERLKDVLAAHPGSPRCSSTCRPPPARRCGGSTTGCA